MKDPSVFVQTIVQSEQQHSTHTAQNTNMVVETPKESFSDKIRFTTTREKHFLNEIPELMQDSMRYDGVPPTNVAVRDQYKRYLMSWKKRVRWGEIDPIEIRTYARKLLKAWNKKIDKVGRRSLI